MPTYIAFLRAVNVGGRVYKMAALREHLTAAGLEDVETYIQTGNLRFRTSMRSAAKVEKHVEEVLREGAGFDVPALLFTPAELTRIHADAQEIKAPDFTADKQRRYVSFFKDPVPAPAAEAIAGWDAEGERAWVIGRAVHIWLDRPSMEAVFFKEFKKVLAPGTNRDLKVVTTLAERWGG
ncbi:MAG: DUF1697 domain-containing protein [Nocardioidaceae bacterium]